MKTIFIIVYSLLQVACASETYYYQDDRKATLKPYIQTSSTKSLDAGAKNTSTLDFYKTNEGHILGVSDTLFLKVNPNVDITKYLKEFDLTLKSVILKDLYLLKLKDKSKTIEISNMLHTKDDVKYAHPNFTQDTRAK